MIRINRINENQYNSTMMLEQFLNDSQRFSSDSYRHVCHLAVDH